MKRILTIILCVFLLAFCFSGCEKNSKQTINLNEVTHSVFYAPLYIAIENGYFADENIEINLVNGGGADNSMTALLSKSADIALMGPETVIYVQNQGKKDAPKVFCQLTQKDGAFIVSRTKNSNFQISDLTNKEILAGRRGGMPAMAFEYILKENNLVKDIDYTLNFDVQYNLMTSAFLEGTADYCTVFEPTASEYESQGKWYVVASIGSYSGEIPYTSFIALNSYLTENEELVKKFISSLKKAINYLYTENEETVANLISKQFPSTEVKWIKKSISSYKEIDAWKKDFIPTKSSFDRLQNIMINAGELTQKVEFNDLVETKYLT